MEIRCSVCDSMLLTTREIAGYLYVLSNNAMPGLLKIGLTTRAVEDRVAELNAATGVPSPFVLEAYFESADPSKDEAAVHRRYAAQRNRGKEFFRLDLSDTIQAVRDITGCEGVCREVQTQDRAAQEDAYAKQKKAERRGSNAQCAHDERTDQPARCAEGRPVSWFLFTKRVFPRIFWDVPRVEPKRLRLSLPRNKELVRIKPCSPIQLIYELFLYG